MATLKEQMAADAPIFLNSEEFGEEVTYTPKGGVGRPLSMVIAEATTRVGGEVVTIDGEINAMFTVASAPELGAGDIFTRSNGEVYRLDRGSPRFGDGVWLKVRLAKERLPVLGR